MSIHCDGRKERGGLSKNDWWDRRRDERLVEEAGAGRKKAEEQEEDDEKVKGDGTCGTETTGIGKLLNGGPINGGGVEGCTKGALKGPQTDPSGPRRCTKGARFFALFSFTEA